MASSNDESGGQGGGGRGRRRPPARRSTLSGPGAPEAEPVVGPEAPAGAGEGAASAASVVEFPSGAERVDGEDEAAGGAPTDAEGPGAAEASAPVEGGRADGTLDEATFPSLVGDDTAPPEEDSVEDTGAFLRGLIEAVLFVSDRPLTLKELARAVRIDRRRCEELVEELRQGGRERGVRVDEVGGALVLRTNPAYATYVRAFLDQRPVRLSRAQLETLAIVAYRQPLTRPEVDDIRGVDSGPVLKTLLERDLVRILGKRDEPGRPMLYGTTQTFLEFFSLRALTDLPTLREFTELTDESRRTFESEVGEEAPEEPLAFARRAAPTSDGTAPAGDDGTGDDATGEEEAVRAASDALRQAEAAGAASDEDEGEAAPDGPLDAGSEAGAIDADAPDESTGDDGEDADDDADDDDADDDDADDDDADDDDADDDDDDDDADDDDDDDDDADEDDDDDADDDPSEPEKEPS